MFGNGIDEDAFPCKSSFPAAPVSMRVELHRRNHFLSFSRIRNVTQDVRTTLATACATARVLQLYELRTFFMSQPTRGSLERSHIGDTILVTAGPRGYSLSSPRQPALCPDTGREHWDLGSLAQFSVPSLIPTSMFLPEALAHSKL